MIPHNNVARRHLRRLYVYSLQSTPSRNGKIQTKTVEMCNFFPLSNDHCMSVSDPPPHIVKSFFFSIAWWISNTGILLLHFFHDSVFHDSASFNQIKRLSLMKSIIQYPAKNRWESLHCKYSKVDWTNTKYFICNM